MIAYHCDATPLACAPDLAASECTVDSPQRYQVWGLTALILIRLANVMLGQKSPDVEKHLNKVRQMALEEIQQSKQAAL